MCQAASRRATESFFKQCRGTATQGVETVDHLGSKVVAIGSLEMCRFGLMKSTYIWSCTTFGLARKFLQILCDSLYRLRNSGSVTVRYFWMVWVHHRECAHPNGRIQVLFTDPTEL